MSRAAYVFRVEGSSVLLAERFPSQVMTTVNWLTELAPRDLALRCIELNLFTDPDDSARLCATFQRIFPIDDITERVLGPTVDGVSGGVSAKLAERTRRQRSVQVIVDNDLIPQDAPLVLSLETLLRPEFVAAVKKWIAEEPDRGTVTWRPDRQKPLRWASAPAVEGWSASKLAEHIVETATRGEAETGFAGPGAWTYNGRDLYSIANEFLALPSPDAGGQ